jgi:hypothetical protein
MKAGEIVGKDLVGWTIQKTYTPHLQCSAWGFFPVLFNVEDDNPVVTLTEELAKKVIAMLPDRRHKIDVKFMLVNAKDGIAFDVFGDNRPWGFEGEYQRQQITLLTEARCEARLADKKIREKFMWAPGLIS